MRRSLIGAAVLTGVAVFACSKTSESGTPAGEPAKAPPSKAAEAPGQAASAPATAPAMAAKSPALMDPSRATLTAPAKYSVSFETTKGEVIIDVTRSWAPNGADRFYNLVKAGFFTDTAFFRVIGGFMAQLGISGDPAVNDVWRDARIPDDPVKQSNLAGYVTFAAASMPNSRTTQFFINFADNGRLDTMRFAPFGKVRDMETVKKLHAGYGEGAPRGRGPSQGRMQKEGNSYLKAEFPKLDYVKKATVIDEAK